jgi:hypothetical protein
LASRTTIPFTEAARGPRRVEGYASQHVTGIWPTAGTDGYYAFISRRHHQRPSRVRRPHDHGGVCCVLRVEFQPPIGKAGNFADTCASVHVKESSSVRVWFNARDDCGRSYIL